MPTFTYFAYGSNMLSERLTERCPRAEAIGNAFVEGYALSFSKRSNDGSGKATLIRSAGSTVHGVLFRIPTSECAALDEAEGPGYRRNDDFAVVENANGTSISTTTYLAEESSLNESLCPYDWYLELVTTGAKQHGLPEDYRQLLEATIAERDAMPSRKTARKARTLLNRLWAASLGETDRKVLTIARRLYSALPAAGACYRATFFLAYHLKQRRGIDGIPKVGFVNDGTDELFSSHAWYVLDGRVTDLGISRPLRPEIQRRGPLTILGRDIEPGWPWTYHEKRSTEGARIVEELLRDPRTARQISEGEELHRLMVATATSQEHIREYLDGAPDRLDYETLAARMRLGGD